MAEWKNGGMAEWENRPYGPGVARSRDRTRLPLNSAIPHSPFRHSSSVSQGEISPVPEMTPARCSRAEANPTSPGDRLMRTRSLPRILFVLAPAVALACHAQDLTDPSAAGSEQTLGMSTPLSSGVSDLPVFDPNGFVPAVTNPLFPLPLGRRLLYRGTEDDLPETVVTDITLGHKTILGVPVTVVLDRVFLNGELRRRPSTGMPRTGKAMSGISARIPRSTTMAKL